MANSESNGAPEAEQIDFRKMFGDRMKLAREHQGITQKELTHRLRTNQSTVSNWERGETAPLSTTIGRIAKAIPTSADFLLGLTDDPRPPSQRDEERSARKVSDAVDRVRGATPPPQGPQQ